MIIHECTTIKARRQGLQRKSKKKEEKNRTPSDGDKPMDCRSTACS